jgi:hypothetical protein
MRGRAAGVTSKPRLSRVVLQLESNAQWTDHGVAPRSTIVQMSPVHSGLCDDPKAAFERLVRNMVDCRFSN